MDVKGIKIPVTFPPPSLGRWRITGSDYIYSLGMGAAIFDCTESPDVTYEGRIWFGNSVKFVNVFGDIIEEPEMRLREHILDNVNGNVSVFEYNNKKFTVFLTPQYIGSDKTVSTACEIVENLAKELCCKVDWWFSGIDAVVECNDGSVWVFFSLPMDDGWYKMQKQTCRPRFLHFKHSGEVLDYSFKVGEGCNSEVPSSRFSRIELYSANINIPQTPQNTAIYEYVNNGLSPISDFAFNSVKPVGEFSKWTRILKSVSGNTVLEMFANNSSLKLKANSEKFRLFAHGHTKHDSGQTVTTLVQFRSFANGNMVTHNKAIEGRRLVRRHNTTVYSTNNPWLSGSKFDCIYNGQITAVVNHECIGKLYVTGNGDINVEKALPSMYLKFCESKTRDSVQPREILEDFVSRAVENVSLGNILPFVENISKNSTAFLVTDGMGRNVGIAWIHGKFCVCDIGNKVVQEKDLGDFLFRVKLLSEIRSG